MCSKPDVVFFLMYRPIHMHIWQDRDVKYKVSHAAASHGSVLVYQLVAFYQLHRDTIASSNTGMVHFDPFCYITGILWFFAGLH